MIAYVFPGQNSQYAGMCRDLAQKSPIAAEVLRTVDEAVGRALTEVMFGEDDEALRATHVQQPAIFAHSIAALRIIESEIEISPAMVAGHSLGEYSALVAARSMSLADAAGLVAVRGELMAQAAQQAGGTMAAVLKLDQATVEEIVQKASPQGILTIANYNNPGQIVISGERNAVRAACELVKSHGGRSIPLRVSGAFHSSLMAPAADKLQGYIQAAQISPARVPIVSNVDASPRTDVAGIKQALSRQVTQAVRWEQSVRRMIDQGIDTFIEIGPGAILTNTINRIDPSVSTFSVENTDDMANLASALR